MSSLITSLFIGGVFLLFVALGRAHQDIPHGLSIEYVTQTYGTAYSGAKSPFWDHDSGKLYVSAVLEKHVLCLHIATGQLTFASLANNTVSGNLGPVVPVNGTRDQFITAVGPDIVIFTWDSDTNCTDPVTRVVATVDNTTAFNNGKCDSHGRLWAGTHGPSDNSTRDGFIPNRGALYRLTSDLVLKKKASSVSVSDGMAWNSDYTTMYYVDAANYSVVAYDFDSRHGSISNKRLAFNLTSNNVTGIVDGVTVDTKGNLWIAVYGNAVYNIDPVEGKVLRTLHLPAVEVDDLTFGGDMWDTLYVTSFSNTATPEGTGEIIWAVRGLGVRGFPGNKFTLNHKFYDYHV